MNVESFLVSCIIGATGSPSTDYQDEWTQADWVFRPNAQTKLHYVVGKSGTKSEALPLEASDKVLYKCISCFKLIFFTHAAFRENNHFNPFNAANCRFALP
jgi:hypothetical protein